ncbi:ABC transporter substrate-binding protein [Lihuaxuella thermophila]|uniref:Raffinose/stachyose/melibiose transport system substrate-binding protein n=1 Tax=Lihuaxuella thermophila TaxID=1173111 RepID=A0A1H8GU04_9BACL|nr:extracellular solute-binding protein [Lihuaxuella thermophila]SEN46957.1 raffinose/stachyose/melibiose transport system substrate-binding protein [Lihuaxuella thermophila]
MKKLISLMLAALLPASLLAGCSSSESGKVKIEFFQNKPEAKSTFEKLAEKFEKENPTIDVVVSTPPDAETVLKTRIAKNDVPDVIGSGLNATFVELAKNGIFADFSNDPQLQNIQPAYVDMIKNLTGLKEVHGIPYSANANGVLYNKALFKELGLTVPKTWDEFIAVADKIKAAGKIPFYHTYKDSWTTLIPFNALASNLPGDQFFKDRESGKTTFRQAYREVAEKQLKLLEYGTKDNFGKGYSDGNAAFAKGESVMYLQGIWAIPEIKKANPNIEIGTFPFPASNDTAKNKLVSGVDTLLTLSAATQHKEESKKFIDFLLKPENVKFYIDEQKVFSSVKGVTQDDPSVSDLKESFQKGLLVDFADHYIPSAMKVDKIVQGFLQKKDMDEYLKTLDTEWNKVQERK